MQYRKWKKQLPRFAHWQERWPDSTVTDCYVDRRFWAWVQWSPYFT